ncbi:C40 family peptidase [Paenibacillus radicis (ex Xue et al. 2023)]|uniref:C40 family peptidase n=1 Tax=Paenibacillus radicis (ex Xue et al. 2023) TaxID=2972489 RepID=A0ABT1YCR5_9BACL|nr:C40 family peptidase [Paenibacillus radicis (ex Xue et al. 2023)]MCR8631000.1 C40 family peptidase [Paenibacillus radicis (ex Xue et al. 2023)]
MGIKQKLLAAAALLIILMGCNSKAAQKEASTQFGGMDERLFNDTITEHDRWLRKGDAYIEQEISGYRAQDNSTSYNQTVKIHGLEAGQLVEVRPNPSIAATQGSYAENVISTATMYFGTPYEYGSDRSDPSTFDCSDFTRWAFLSSLGMDLPKDSRNQALYVQTFSNRNYSNIYDAQRGDLLFFISFNGVDPQNYRNKNKSIESITHTGIYLGNGKMIHTASAATGGVRIDNVFGNHLEWRFVLGGSVLEVK